jgi:hypothetical protein
MNTYDLNITLGGAADVMPRVVAAFEESRLGRVLDLARLVPGVGEPDGAATELDLAIAAGQPVEYVRILPMSRVNELVCQQYRTLTSISDLTGPTTAVGTEAIGYTGRVLGGPPLEPFRRLSASHPGVRFTIEYVEVDQKDVGYAVCANGSWEAAHVMLPEPFRWL